LKREEKAAVVDAIAGQIGEADAIFAIDYRGISVPQAADLRERLRESDASFRVVKNRLTKLAADKAGREELKDLLDGPTALTFVRGDTALAAKAIVTFDREHDVLTFKGGFMDELTLDEDRFKSIARLPSRDVLHGQLAGVVASPITGLVRGLNALIAGLAIQLGQIADQGMVGGQEPPKESPPEADAEPAEPVDGEDEGEAGEQSIPAESSESAAPPAEDASEEEAPAAGAESPEEEAPAAEAETPAEEAPAEQEPTESGAEAETSSKGDPSQAEGEASEASTETESEPPAADAERAEPDDGDSGGEASEQSTPAE
jgi:large subunit ribosomal protein L10